MPPPSSNGADRPTLDPLLTAFVRSLRDARPHAFGHLEPARILFVAGAARRAARATIRGFPDAQAGQPQAPEIRIGDQRIRYEICLRPRFFLDARPAARARILAHELWHIGLGCDGALHPARRHGARPEVELEADLDAKLAGFDPRGTALWSALEAPGERWLSAWRIRPPGTLRDDDARRRYDERDLFAAIVRQE